jgi:hypothetical protein
MELLAHQALTLADGAVDVGTAPELDAEQQFDRIVERKLRHPARSNE